jgi:hypothetical protein
VLSDKEQAVFEDLTKRLDGSGLEKSAMSKWRRGRRVFRWLLLGGLMLSIVFFPRSLIVVALGLVAAGVGMWGMFETRTSRGEVAGGSTGRGVLGWLEDHGLIVRWSIDSIGPAGAQTAMSAFGAAAVPGTNEWHRGVDLLASYTGRERSSRVPREHVEDGFPLGRWVILMRVARRVRQLNAEQIKELDEAGINWDLNA